FAKILWQGTLLCIGKKKNQIIIDAIRTDKPCILACPWSSGTSYSLEILDRMIAFPKMISSMVLTRMENVRKIYTNEPWIIALLDNPAKAARWRQAMQRGFIKASPEQEKEKVSRILSLWKDADKNQNAKKSANALYQCIKSMVTSDNERDCHSHSLADEDEEVQYLSE